MEDTAPRTRPALFTVLLTSVAGYVDAIGYVSLGQIYVANMSCNSVAFGIDIAHLDWREVWIRGWPILSFFIGLLISRLALTHADRTGKRQAIGGVFLLEAAFLLWFAWFSNRMEGIFLAAIAMGLQAAVVSRLGGSTVYTCFVTGTLVKTAGAFSELIWAIRDSRSGKAGAAAAAIRSGWFAANWIGYVIGAIGGALVLARTGVISILPAAAVII